MDLDRVRCCPRCERVLVDGPDGPRCLYCGYDFSVSPEDIDAGDYFTAGETAVLGLLAGLEIGVALGAAGVGPSSNPDMMAINAGIGALLGGLFGGWLGARLAQQWRRKFRLLLLSACAAGLVVLIAVFAGWGGTDTLLGGTAALTGFIYLTAQRAAARRADEGEVRESSE